MNERRSHKHPDRQTAGQMNERRSHKHPDRQTAKQTDYVTFDIQWLADKLVICVL